MARDSLTAVPWSALRRLPGRETFIRVVELPGGDGDSEPAREPASQSVIVKRFAGRRGCQARDEFHTLSSLAAAGLPVPQPLAWASSGGLSALVMARITAAGHPFEARAAAAPEHLGERLRKADELTRRRLTSALLELLVKFHGDGTGPSWYHRDLYLSHILVGPGERLTMIDVGRVRAAPRRRQRARRWFAKDLAALLHSTPASVSRAQRLRFLLAWLRGTGRLGDSTPRAAARRLWRSWAREVQRRRRAMAAHRPRGGEPGPFGSNWSSGPHEPAPPAPGAAPLPAPGSTPPPPPGFRPPLEDAPAPAPGHGEAPSTPPRTIVRLPGWIGDAVMAEPVLRALAGAASSSLTLLGSAPLLSLFSGRFPGVARRALTGREGPEHYAGQELALFLNGSLRSVIAARRAGVGMTCGWADGGRRPWLSHPVERQLGRRAGRRPTPLPFAAAAAMLGEELGLAMGELRPRLVPADEARTSVAGRLAQAGLVLGEPYLLLSAGGRADSAKAWPASHWSELIADLARGQALPVVLTAGPGEAAAARAAWEGASSPAAGLLYLDPAPDLPELMALAASAAVFVGTDSGPAHLARAVGTPTVVITGPTDPLHSALPSSGETAARRRVLRVELACGPCHRERCPLAGADRGRCMGEITPRAVLDAVRDLLGGKPGEPAATVPAPCRSDPPLGLTGAVGVGSGP